MTLTLFPQLKNLDPFAIGFEQMFEQLEDLTTNVIKNAPNWPPYNIKKVKDNKYVIEMAVAGFSKSDIEITLEGNNLTIKGASQDETKEEDFIWKGIAGRSFKRSFTLADKVEIKDAEVANGMLKVWLENMIAQQDMVKKIAIK